MKLEVELAPELERQLQQAANRAGIGLDAYILQLLQQNLERPQPHRPTGTQLSAPEAALLQRINCSLSPAEWRRYRHLQDKRRTETLTLEEQQEAISFSDRLEHLNAERLQALAELAALRRITVAALMDALDLKPVRG